MSESPNPLIPGGYDIVWSTIFALSVALIVWAIISLARAARRQTSWQALLWVLVILFVPVVGPLAWLLVGRRAAQNPPETRGT